MSGVRTVDPLAISASRLSLYSECGVKFRFRYVHGLKPPRQASRLLFGSVLHAARARWALVRGAALQPMVKEAWRRQAELDAPLARFLGAYEALSEHALELEDEIRLARPELTHIRRSKEWKASPLAAEIAVLTGDLVNAFESSAWEFTVSDPLPALYDESLRWADRYEERWRFLPPALITEYGFAVPYGEFRLTGRIDEITHVYDDQGELQGYAVVDAKTVRDDAFAPRFLEQGTVYVVAVRELVKSGELELDPALPVWFCVDELRLLRYRFFKVGERDERRLRHHLRQYRAGVAGHVFLPAAARCQFAMCDYRAICEHYHHSDEAEDFDLNRAFNGDLEPEPVA